MEPFFLVAMVVAYLLVVTGLIKFLRWWFDYCDARAVSDFNRRCALAEAEEMRCRVGEDTQ